jgi:phosphoglucomutase
MDNGYKVYWENGCQILSPHDSGIQEAIMENSLPASWDTKALDTHPLVEDISHLISPYVEDVAKLAASRYTNNFIISTNISPLSSLSDFVYTPMHGVGLNVFTRVIQSLGIQQHMHPVKEQVHPPPLNKS